MARRRMFSQEVVDQDKFLDMPATARLLYYDLGMEADDDGFVSPKRVMRKSGAMNDDLNVLIAREFVIPFESGVIVIKHWKENNYIQRDRYKETLYLTEKSQLTEENNVYKLDTECIQNVRIGKVREGKVREDHLFDSFWKTYPNKKAKIAAKKAWDKINPDKTLASEIINSIETYKKSTDWKKEKGKYIPHPATRLNRGQWEDEIEEEIDTYWEDAMAEAREGRT